MIPSTSNATAAVTHFVFQGSDLTAQCVLDGSSMFLCSHRDVRLADNSLPPAAARTGIQFNRAADRVKAFTGHRNTQFLASPLPVSYESLIFCTSPHKYVDISMLHMPRLNENL